MEPEKPLQNSASVDVHALKQAINQSIGLQPSPTTPSDISGRELQNRILVQPTVADAIATAVAEERQRCLQIVEAVRSDANGYDNAVHDGYDMACDEIAEGIAALPPSEFPK
jgi:hypothetical protein